MLTSILNFQKCQTPEGEKAEQNQNNQKEMKI